MNTLTSSKRRLHIGRVGQRRQIVIPEHICEELGLFVGDFVEVSRDRHMVLVKPQKITDRTEVLTPREKTLIRKGEEEIITGKAKSWKTIKHEMGR
jgi:bifunctional DNA-binding transcriptional regulator/antitoxin component of YhaV-PrlF toxin-antitoxin module